jgi:hypothetical protein
MNKPAFALIAFTLAGCGEDPAVAAFPPPDLADRPRIGIFEGKFPCDGCNRLKTALVLYQGEAAGRYALRQVRVAEEGIDDSQGTWTVTRGARALPEAPVYRLDPDGGGSPIFYLKIDENILLLLDASLNLRVGDAAMSFTLSRTR